MLCYTLAMASLSSASSKFSLKTPSPKFPATRSISTSPLRPFTVKASRRCEKFPSLTSAPRRSPIVSRPNTTLVIISQEAESEAASAILIAAMEKINLEIRGVRLEVVDDKDDADCMLDRYSCVDPSANPFVNVVADAVLREYVEAIVENVGGTISDHIRETRVSLRAKFLSVKE